MIPTASLRGGTILLFIQDKLRNLIQDCRATPGIVWYLALLAMTLLRSFTEHCHAEFISASCRILKHPSTSFTLEVLRVKVQDDMVYAQNFLILSSSNYRNLASLKNFGKISQKSLIN